MPARPWGGRTATVLLVGVLALYGLFVLSRTAPGIASPDANGYYAQGSLLATTGRTWFAQENDCQYVGVHWLMTPDDRFFSRYPPGMAAAVAVLYKTLGYKASVLLNPALALLALVGLHRALRRLAGPWWALAGVALLAVNPIFNVHAIAEDAHMMVTCCLVWGLLFLLRWSQDGRLRDAFAAGVALGIIPTVRYPEALFGIGAIVFLVWVGLARASRKTGKMGTVPTSGQSPFSPFSAWLAAAAGAAVPIVPLLVRNHLAFGAFWRTGYSLTHEQTGFGVDYFRQHFVSYIRQIQGDGLGLVFALGVIGMIAMMWDRRRRALGATLALLVVPTMLLYMAYYWGPQMFSSATQRFLLPTYPCYIVAAVWFLADLTANRTRALKTTLVAAVVALQVVQGGFNSLVETKQLHYQKLVLAKITDALDATAKRGDVVISNPQVLQHLDFVRHWKLVDISQMRMGGGPGLMPPGMGEDDNAPSPMQVAKMRKTAERFAGKTPMERERMIADDVRRWAGAGKVYFVGTASDLDRMRGIYFGGGSFRPVATIPLPEPPKQPEMEGLGGAAMRRRSQPTPSVDRRPTGPGVDGPSGPRDARAGAMDSDDLRPGPLFGPPSPQVGPSSPQNRPGGVRSTPVDGRGPRGPGGGGPFGLGFLQGEREVIIAEWIGPAPRPF